MRAEANETLGEAFCQRDDSGCKRPPWRSGGSSVLLQIISARVDKSLLSALQGTTPRWLGAGEVLAPASASCLSQAELCCLHHFWAGASLVLCCQSWRELSCCAGGSEKPQLKRKLVPACPGGRWGQGRAAAGAAKAEAELCRGLVSTGSHESEQPWGRQQPQPLVASRDEGWGWVGFA